jgi:hypothetical protein
VAKLNSKAWFSLFGAFTLIFVFVFGIFRYEPLISFEGVSPGIGLLSALSPKYTVRVMVEYSLGYSEGDPFHPASGVAVSLVNQVYTSSVGEVVFIVPAGSYVLSAENPVEPVNWSGVITVQGNVTVRVRFDLEKTTFERISVNANFSQDSSKLEFQFMVPTANATYLSSISINYLDSVRRQCTLDQKIPFTYDWLKSETLETYGMELSGREIVYVFPESSYILLGLIFVDM